MHIKDCAAIVTGGASGMGAAVANLLSELGANVTTLDLNAAAITRGLPLTCDVTNPTSVEAALQKAKAQHGPARICVNCAGIVQSRRMINKQGPMPLEEFRKVIEVNLIGTYNVMQLAAAQMITLDPINESGERGVIINTASIAAYDGQIGQTAYSASKGALVSLTLPAARELAQFGIRVMTIAPGLVNTPMFDKLPPDTKAALAASVPFPKRLAHASEFAALARHVIENIMLNGEVIRLDGALRMPPL